ncbi:MAG: PD40 domain-containing protein [Chloroflexi bacterium]|nr:PD40 domain-containing protein [Chloroflexota bacterium]
MNIAIKSSLPEKKSSVVKGLFLFLVVLVVIAIAAGTAPRSNASTAEKLPPDAAQAAQVMAEQTAQPAPAYSLLVWSGAAPDRPTPEQPGQIALLSEDGTVTPLFDVPAPATRLAVCATSPDGSVLAFYAGDDNGALYLQSGFSAPVQIEAVPALTCLGGGRVEFSPDGRWLAYIAYEPGAAQSEFADGFLRVVDTGTAQPVFNGENATAFELIPGGVAYISFYTNDRNEADEAAITVWDGSARREVVTLRPSGPDCRFVSGQLAAAPNARYLVVMGQRCKGGDSRTQWQLYAINPAEGSATLAASDFQVGAFVPFARTNDIFFARDGSRAYFTIPDGVTAYTAGVKAVNLADLTVSDVIERQAVLPNFSGAANVFPQFSPDGRWLALVVTSPNNDNTLTVLDLANPTVAPITLPAGSRGDVFSALAFAPDGRRLYTIMGGAFLGADNSLISIDLSTGSSNRVARGRFAQWLVVMPDGQIAVTDWQIPADAKEPPYLNTVVINPDTGITTTWFTGADVVDGKVTNRRFALPLAWR